MPSADPRCPRILSSVALSILPSLFSGEAYVRLHDPPVLVLTNESATIPFFRIADTCLLSLNPKAPYLQGSLDQCSSASFLEILAKGCHKLSATQVTFRLPPEIPELTLCEGGSLISFLGKDVIVACEDVNYHLSITDQPFIDGLPSDQRRVLTRQKVRGVRVERAGFEDLPLLHKVLMENRKAKGYPTSISLACLQQAFIELPESYMGYLVWERDMAVGAAVVVRVNEQVCYSYLLGHILGAKGSPVLSAIEAIYQDCQMKGISIFDLGTASLEGAVIDGLASFKRSIGGIETAKKTCSFAYLA